MGFFDKIFGSKNKDRAVPMPTRKLNLQFEPTPANASKFAEQFQNAVKSNENIDLEFSVEALSFADSFLQRFRDEGITINDFAETIFVTGCFIGQIMVHNNNASWINPKNANLPNGITMMPIVLKLPNGTITDPIAKAFKRFYNGEADSLTFYYQVFTSDPL